MHASTTNHGARAPIALLIAAALAAGAFAYLAWPAGAQTPAASPTATRTIELAPIDALDIRILESFPPQYQAVITSGLPGGCASLDSISAVRTGARIDITVRNAINVPAGGACTTIYGSVQKVVDLGSNFDEGVTYTVIVNDGGSRSMTKTFVAQASATATPTPIVTPVSPGMGTPAAPRPANTGNAGLGAIGDGSLTVDLAVGIALASTALALAMIADRMRRSRL